MNNFHNNFLPISFIVMVLSIALLLAVMFFKFVVMLNCVKFLGAAAAASLVFGLTFLYTKMIGY